MPDDIVLPVNLLPIKASASLARLILSGFDEWEVGVGDGAIRDAAGNARPIPYDRSQNDLVGENHCWRPVDPGFPVLQGGAIIAKTTYQPHESNFDIFEKGLRARDKVTGERVLLARIAEDSGRKRGGLWFQQIEFVV